MLEKKPCTILDCQNLKNILQRKFVSRLHQKAWQDYESILVLRTQFAGISRIMLSMFLLLTSSENFMLTQRDIDKDLIPNRSLAEACLPYARQA